MRLTSVLAPVLGAGVLFAALPATAHADSTTSGTAAVRAAAADTTVRFATFNVRTSRADIGTARHWLKRASSVAGQIATERPDVVAIQELGPGRADGKKIKLGGAPRQTETLLSALKGAGAGEYDLVRTTAYVKPGTKHGTQGTRILYNTDKVKLISDCPETTGKKNYNGSCSLDMPRLAGESAKETRSAAYAQFQDLRTGQKFFAVSVHLDDRHSGSAAKEAKLDDLREAQTRAVYAEVADLAGDDPVVWGGDLNSWKTKAGRNAPYDVLTAKGFRDAVTAGTTVNDRYPTVNHWRSVLKPNAVGRQVALDVVMVKDGAGFERYENVMKVADSSRPSDHNMVISDLIL